MSKHSLLRSLFWLVLFVLWAMPALPGMIVDTAWVRRYNGPVNEYDYARDVAVDDFGSVYVAGASVGNGLYNYDYITIKYYPNGDTAWVRRYNGPGNAQDYAFAIAVDGSGNVYVTGQSVGIETYEDYATIKYYPNGDTAWVRRYNGFRDSSDVASAIVVDDSGDVYVTGKSSAVRWPCDDYATIKYYPNGDTAWVRRYNGPANSSDVACDVVVDESRNVYVTGWSLGDGGRSDYATVKYDGMGNELWVARYNGADNTDEGASAIAVDDSGNVYVTGESDDDYASIKYYPNGDTAWVRKYNGPGNNYDFAADIGIDDSHNVCVTGLSLGSTTSYDYATIKYCPNGDTAWVRRYNGPGNDDDRAVALAIDHLGNIYATGGSVGNGPSYDYATIRYYPNGDTAWVRKYNGPGNNYDFAADIGLDGSGSVYVTGGSVGNVTNYDCATIKYFQALRGDVNGDGKIDVGDVVYLINYLYKNGSAPVPLLAGDVTCDGTVDIGDVVYLINYLFKGGPAPTC